MLDENRISPALMGFAPLSRFHKDHPLSFEADGKTYDIRYVPAESDTALFGGNSNWRGPVWFPLNFLLIEALDRYNHYYKDSLKVECPLGSGNMLTLSEVGQELSRRLLNLFLRVPGGGRPQDSACQLFKRPEFRDLVLFHEYYDGDNGRGCGASHQTGWTAWWRRLSTTSDGGRRQRCAKALRSRP